MSKSGKDIIRLSTSLYSTINSSRVYMGGSRSYLSTICSRPCVGGSSYFSVMSKGFLSLFKKSPKDSLSLFKISSKELVNSFSDKVEAIMLNPEILPAAKVKSLKGLVERMSNGQLVALMNAYWKKDPSSLTELLNAYWIKFTPWISQNTFGTSLSGLVDASLDGNTNEPIKGIAVFDFVFRCEGILLNSEFDPYDNEDEFKFKFDNKGMQITVHVFEKEHKEHLMVLVADDTVRVLSTAKAEVYQILEVIELPQFITYDPYQVTGSIIEGGDLTLYFPYSEDKKNIPSSFQINIV